MRSKWLFVISVLLLLWLLSYTTSKFIEEDIVDFSDKIAIIPIEGVISVSGAEGEAVSSDIVDYINAAGQNDNIKAVIFEINSPGGTVVATEEIAGAIGSLDKPKVALIREVGASGGYWVASAADKIVADPMSITGSIGVIGSYLQFAGLMEKYGVKYEQLTAGKYKDLGSPFKNLEDDEEEILTKELNIIHAYFVSEIARNRNMPSESVKKLAEGQIFLGIEALELGLVDYLGGKDLALNLTKQMANLTTAKIVTYKKEKSFLQQIIEEAAGNIFYSMGRGIGYELMKVKEAKILEITV